MYSVLFFSKPGTTCRDTARSEVWKDRANDKWLWSIAFPMHSQMCPSTPVNENPRRPGNDAFQGAWCTLIPSCWNAAKMSGRGLRQLTEHVELGVGVLDKMLMQVDLGARGDRRSHARERLTCSHGAADRDNLTRATRIMCRAIEVSLANSWQASSLPTRRCTWSHLGRG